VGNIGKVGVGVEILKGLELEPDILLPTPQPWMPYLNDGLYYLGHGGANFCNRDFLTDHKFAMGLRSGEFPG